MYTGVFQNPAVLSRSDNTNFPLQHVIEVYYFLGNKNASVINSCNSIISFKILDTSLNISSHWRTVITKGFQLCLRNMFFLTHIVEEKLGCKTDCMLTAQKQSEKNVKYIIFNILTILS